MYFNLFNNLYAKGKELFVHLAVYFIENDEPVCQVDAMPTRIAAHSVEKGVVYLLKPFVNDESENKLLTVIEEQVYF